METKCVLKISSHIFPFLCSLVLATNLSFCLKSTLLILKEVFCFFLFVCLFLFFVFVIFTVSGSTDMLLKTFLNFHLYFFLIFYFFKILKSLILTCVPKHEPPSHLPPHNISLGLPHAPAPSKLHPTSDMDWRFNSYMTVYMLMFRL